MRPLPSPRSATIRPLPSPPTSASLHTAKSSASSTLVWPQDSSTYSTPMTAQSFAIQLPTAFPGARLSKARRREGHIFTHSPSSSMSSLDSAASCSIISAEFWMPPETIVSIPMQAAYLSVTPPSDEPKVMPPTPPTPKTKPKSKPANIIIPRNTPSATVVSPTATLLSSTPVPFPTNTSEAMTMPCTPRSPLSPFLPPTPTRQIQSPNARIRKLAKLQRTLGENIPLELVFPSGNAPAPPQKVSKRAKAIPEATRASHLGPRLTVTRPRPSATTEWPLTPTPDYTVNTEAHNQTAVGLHYALGMDSFPTRAVALEPAEPAAPTSPPPFTNVFTVDDVSWERARQALMAPRAQKAKRTVGGVRKYVLDNGRGTWRKKENTWSGEWNVEDMEALQVQLRRLKRR
ncbi:hypothetical protein B0H17DRAFT_1215855 [Mycena rosella]|uniref:Uncharacterized protein n=1 Tax=Mycena rosella TaxID=1033263 RepID=A0AAD7CD65_MYCRO|nr:hypothetical protein B0H17DRAFT_1215855 [Mycena rosella]